MLAHITTMHTQYKMEKVNIKTIHVKLTPCRLRCFVFKSNTLTGNIVQNVYRKPLLCCFNIHRSGPRCSKYLAVLLFQYTQIRS